MLNFETTGNPTKSEYEEKVKNYIDQLDKQISDAESKYLELSDEAKQEMSAKLQELKQKRGDLQKYYDDLIKSAEDGWDEVKKNLESTTSEISAAVEGIIDGLDYGSKKSITNRVYGI